MKHTMMGVSPLREPAVEGQDGQDGQDGPAARPVADNEAQGSTEVGVPAFDPPERKDSPRGPGLERDGRFARTIAGVGLHDDGPAPPQSGALAVDYAPAKGRTMLGGPDASAAASGADLPAGVQTPGRAAAALEYSLPKGRTMLGVPDAAAVSGAVRRAAAEHPDAYRQVLADTQPAQPAQPAVPQPPTELDMAPRTGTASGTAPAPSLHFERDSRESYRASTPIPGPPRRVTGLLYGAALLAVSLFGAAFWLWHSQRDSSDVQVSVVSHEGGEAMRFRVLDAPSGTTVEFGDQEQPLKSGEARFPLAQDSLVVGENTVPATVVYPDGESLSLRVPLHVDYRLFVDTAPLRAGKAGVDVVIAASQGTRVSLDGKEVALDEQGRGIQSYPVDVVEGARSGVIEHVVKYRIEPRRGEPIVGELNTKIAVTMLQLDSPGRTVVTDGATVQLAGAVAKGTTLTVDDAPITVNDDGRFLHILRLPEPGHYTPRLLAQAPEKAPLAITLDVTRVENLEAAAAAFNADSTLSYDLIAQNPAMYKGQRVDFDGRVFNAKTENGRGVLQMLVRDCAQGRQCSLWVTYPALSRVKNDSWVRVLGTVAGQQQFRSQRDEIVTVPKVEAIFLLPAKP